MKQVILHCDMDTFYASVECFHHPEIRNQPVVVGGDAEKRHGIVLTKNQIAKQFDIKTGEALWQAKAKCPNLVIMPPDYHQYQRFSRMARNIYHDYTDRVESFGLDESWLDCSAGIGHLGDGKSVAKEIQKRVYRELGITVSIGVSFNKIFAKLGSDMNKPHGITIIPKETFKEKIWGLPVSDLLMVGRATTKKLKQRGVSTIGQLAETEFSLLHFKPQSPSERNFFSFLYVSCAAAMVS